MSLVAECAEGVNVHSDPSIWEIRNNAGSYPRVCSNSQYLCEMYQVYVM